MTAAGAFYYISVIAGGLNDLFSGDDGADNFPANPASGASAIVPLVIVLLVLVSILWITR